MPTLRLALPSLVLALTLAFAAIPATAADEPKRPQVCEEAMNATKRNEPPAALLKLWDACVATEELSPPDQSIALAERSAANYTVGNIAQARADVEQALALNGRNPLAYYSRGILLAEAKQHTQALRDFSYALMNGMRVPMVFYQRSRSFLERDRPKLALEDMDQAVRLAPRESWVYERRGDLLANIGQPHRALLDYDKALELAPGSGWAWRQRSVAKSMTGDIASALTDADEAIRLKPGESIFWSTRGTLRKQAGLFRQAREDYLKALSLKPGSAIHLNNLAWLLATSADESVLDGAQAVRQAEQAVAQDRTAAWLDTLAAAYARAGRYPEAATAQAETLELLGKGGKRDMRFLKDAQARLELYKVGQPYTEKQPAP